MNISCSITRPVAESISGSIIDCRWMGGGGGGGFSGLLDAYPGASAGYSLRRLSITDGNVVRLRRESDSAESDFTAADLVSTVIDDNVIENGEFATGGGGWTAATGWTFGSGTAQSDGTNSGTSYLSQNKSDLIDQWFRVKFTIVAMADSANSGVRMASTSNRTFQQLGITTTGEHSFLVDGGVNSNNAFRFYTTNNTTLTISDVSVEIITPSAAELFSFPTPTATQPIADKDDSAYVAIWYDQSGSGNDATQATLASQPLLIMAGVTGMENGSPAMVFDGVDDSLALGVDLSFTEQGFFTVATLSQTGDIRALYGRFLSNYGRINAASTFSFRAGGSSVTTSGTAVVSGEQFLNTVIAASGQTDIYKDGASLYSAAKTQTTFNMLTIGEANGIWNWDGSMQEIVLYGSDESANRTGIETNIDDHYHMITPFPITP